jgi:type IV pilus assembly protein PilY1
MSTANPLRRALRRAVTTLVAWTLIAGQVMLPVYAQTVPPVLADVPIAAKVSAKPNIVYTLDDSGSMKLNYLPDFVINSAPAVSISKIDRNQPLAPTIARVTVASTAALSVGDVVLIQGASIAAYNGYFTITKIVDATHFEYDVGSSPVTNPGGGKTYVAGTAFCRSGNNTVACTQTVQNANSTWTSVPFYTADFNHMYYNPLVTYLPPLKADGTPLLDTTNSPATTDAKGNQGYNATRYTAVQRDPFGQIAAKNVRDNLNSFVTVPVYCNTDWPVTAGTNLARTDIGDATYGGYRAGSGDYCRINGNAYDAAPTTSGAPAVSDDYNYPYRSSDGSTGPQYFYQNISVKTIWCDANSPNWPRTTAFTCAPGGFTYGPDVSQTCNTGSSMVCNPTVASRNYTPPSCDADSSLTYCARGTGGSDNLAQILGTGSPPECTSCTCDKDFNQVSKKCSIQTSTSCTVDADCPKVPQPIGCVVGAPIYTPVVTPACNNLLWDPGTNANMVPATTLLQDSNASGGTCRHNNQAYGTVPAGLFTYNATAVYPGEGASTQGKFNKAATGSCPAVGNTTIPRHYYTVDSVQFCDTQITTTNDAWKGFGTGICQDKNDLSKYKHVKYGKFKRWDLYSANTVTYPGGRTWLAATTPGPDNSESINYANWYAYYATRLNAAKTTSSVAFSYLTNVPPDPIAYRVGFHTLSDEPTAKGGSANDPTWVDVEDWDLTQRGNFYTALFNVPVTVFKTPTLAGMQRIGNLFETGGSAGVDAEVKPLPAAAKDPVQLSCQSNYHILFTDGVTNQVGVVTSPADQDETVQPPLKTLGNSVVGDPEKDLPTLKVAGAWPLPFKQGSPAVSNTLADVAAYYWARDLRPAMKNDVPNDSGTLNEKDPKKDVAWWQHVNFNAISFGAEGVLDASSVDATMSQLAAGTLSWPDLTNPNLPKVKNGIVAVDDLWHATTMARGKFVYAKSPIEVAYGLASILSGIANQRKSRAAAAFGGQVLDATNNVIYEATIERGWAGDLLKVEIDPADGHEVKTWWQAAVEVGNQVKPTVPGDEPWMDETKRRIVTINSATGAAVPFRFANLSPGQLASLSPNATQQQKIIAYLRGGSTFGGATIEGTGIGQFRARPSAAIGVTNVLGDISNAQAAIVSPPSRPYLDATDPGYSSYVTAKGTRSTRIVAAANDGMVHVINAGPVNPLAAGGGDEVFAFIPKALFRGTAGNPATEDASAIQALTYQDGGIPIYKHHMYVDSSPRVADVDFGNGSGDWHTIVVGGLGKGGGSYYALDLTDPSAADEASAAAKVLWEWTDPDIRYTYGRPVIIKVRDSAYPTGRWVVIVTASYNNVSGKGKIFIIDAHTGTTLRTITTTAGTGSDPSGLAQIHAFVNDYRNQTAEQIYGGDLKGNLWRVDVSTTDSYKTASAVLFAELKDGSGTGQPITTAPQIEIDINNGIDRFVFIGTGRLLDTSDFTDPATPQQQTMYAIRDGSLSTFQTSGLPIQPRTDLQPVNADKKSAIVGGAPNGWYDDLPTSPTAERIVVDVQADVNIALYIGTQAQDDPCVISLPANLYARDFTSGRSLLLDSGGTTIVASLPFAGGAVGGTLVGRVGALGQSLGALISGEVPGTKPVNIQNPVTGPGSRLSWRLLTGE